MKSSLDNYILPGTLTGTEILWIYLIQWKRDVATVTFAVVYFFYSQFAISLTQPVISEAVDQNDSVD